MDGYPTEYELTKIQDWDMKDFTGWMEFIESLWLWESCWSEKDGVYELSTGGWSGNEELIDAMGDNTVMWLVHWYSSKRGGHYVFMTQEAARVPR